jgi:hypothetical protein
VIETARERVRQSVQRDLRFEPSMDRMSRRLRPWRDAWLAAEISGIALLDYLNIGALLSLINALRLRMRPAGPLGAGDWRVPWSP